MSSDQPGTSVGIDLGTTFSAVAWVDASGHVEVLPNIDGELTTQSAVFFEGNTVLVGREAAKAALLEPGKSAQCFKRDMGKERYRREVCGKDMRPEVLSAIVLRKLRQDAEQRLGPIRDAVISVPAYFDDTRRKATQDAGDIAGLTVRGIINEPTAAAISYGYSARSPQSGERIFLVYDLGGGTFDATLMRASGNELATLATDGDVMLGGGDWDQRILNYVADEFARRAGADPREDPFANQDLALRVEQAKRTLARRTSATIPVAHAGQRLGIPLDRTKFAELTSDLLSRTRSTIELLVTQARLTWDQVDEVLLAGGATRMAMVREMVAEVAGKPANATLEEDLAVAKGAAIHAASLRAGTAEQTPAFQHAAAAKLKDLKHHNVNAHSFGVAARDRATGEMRNVVLIPKNSPIPAQQKRSFGVTEANAREVQVTILEGEAPTAKGCKEIGTCRIRGLPAGLPKGSPIDVAFAYSQEGRIHVQARARDADRTVFVEIMRPEGLTANGIDHHRRGVAGLEVV